MSRSSMNYVLAVMLTGDVLVLSSCYFQYIIYQIFSGIINKNVLRFWMGEKGMVVIPL